VIVLDNCKHVLDGCAALVASLLARTGRARVLATSRESLGVPQDPWDRIAACEAVRLSANRAAGVRPSFVVTPDNALLVLGKPTTDDIAPMPYLACSQHRPPASRWAACTTGREMASPRVEGND
jgi:hypothetical protein